MPSYWLGTVTKITPINSATGFALDTHFYGDVDNEGGDTLVFEIRVRSTHAVVVHLENVYPTGLNYDFGEFSSFLSAGIEYEWDIWDSFYVFSQQFGDGVGGTFTLTTEGSSPSVGTGKYGISREIFTPGAHGEITNYLELVATTVPQESNSNKGEVLLTWNNVDRDENGYNVEYVLGGSGQINVERLVSGTKSFTISNLESKKYQFKLVKYDIDSNAVEFASNIVLVPNRTSPAVPLFDSSMLIWEDQGPNSASNQVVKVQIDIPIDARYIQVIAVSGVGARSSMRVSVAGYYVNVGVADNQIVSYKLRSIDMNGNYADSDIISLTIEKRTNLIAPSIIG